MLVAYNGLWQEMPVSQLPLLIGLASLSGLCY